MNKAQRRFMNTVEKCLLNTNNFFMGIQLLLLTIDKAKAITNDFMLHSLRRNFLEFVDRLNKFRGRSNLILLPREFSEIILIDIISAKLELAIILGHYQTFRRDEFGSFAKINNLKF